MASTSRQWGGGPKVWTGAAARPGPAHQAPPVRDRYDRAGVLRGGYCCIPFGGRSARDGFGMCCGATMARSLAARGGWGAGRAGLVGVASPGGWAPREPGAWMAVFADRLVGSIGGGHLEWQAITEARRRLAHGADAGPMRCALGPSLGG